ncbi:TRAP transporter small permease [Maridesulfovibrio salexigens]|uniref:TRAP-type C4-dicarboxylate transport system, small permease component n=1 Tax=Maridesulfovibrio salexigens (strain ATCC 14822 / DSM 2638 / NCIMB 8403 / VKM B-1763) TaxID=526222 RepID=C6BZB3_MARSD|nr:TRAP transporter small permease [Maridesulfovibrio salexigens]ACS80750.1 TRAP-type C4-dicarboxylate transport system, small permease component [Maridesulfovibrio salexigens DSM 2638]
MGNQVIGLINKFEALLKNIAAVCLIGMALLTGADILSRGALDTPIFGVEDIVAVLAVLTTGLALGYAESQKANIGVEFLYSKMNARTRRTVKICTTSLSVALFGLVTWRLYLYGCSMRESGEVSMTLELPTDMVIFALTFGFGCFTLTLLKELIMLFKGEE